MLAGINVNLKKKKTFVLSFDKNPLYFLHFPKITFTLKWHVILVDNYILKIFTFSQN